jgi:hypothetical protein
VNLVAKIIILTAFILPAYSSRAVDNRLALWERLQVVYNLKSWPEYFGLLKTLELASSDLPTKNQCQIKELQILGYMNICDGAVLEPLKSQFLNLGCERYSKTQVANFLKGKLRTASGEKTEASEKLDLTQLYLRSRAWKVQRVTDRVKENPESLRARIPNKCRINSTNEISIVDENNQFIGPSYQYLSLLGFWGVENVEKTCSLYLSKRTEDLIGELKSQIRLENGDDKLIDFRLFVQKGDCLLISKKVEAAEAEYRKASMHANTASQNLFIEHRLNLIAVKNGPEASRSREKQIRDFVFNKEVESGMSQVLVEDYVELASQHKGGLAVAITELLKEGFSNNLENSFVKLIQKSKVNKRIEGELSQLMASNSQVGYLFYLASLNARKDSFGKISMNPESACESLKYLGFRAAMVKDTLETQWSDALACYGVEKFNKKSKFMLDHYLSQSPDSKKFTEYVGVMLNSPLGSQKVCEYALNNKTFFLENTFNYLIALSSCMDSKLSQSAQFVEDLVFRNKETVQELILEEYKKTAKTHPVASVFRVLVQKRKIGIEHVFGSNDGALAIALYGENTYLAVNSLSNLQEVISKLGECAVSTQVEKYIECTRGEFQELVEVKSRYKAAMKQVGAEVMSDKTKLLGEIDAQVRSAFQRDLERYMAQGQLNTDEFSFLKRQLGKHIGVKI